MPGSWDLEIDTYWIRRAAASTDEAAQSFAVAAADRLPVRLSLGSLGKSGSADAVVALVNERNGQAHAAADQLRAVTAATGRQLVDAADHFDRLEHTIAVPIR